MLIEHGADIHIQEGVPSKALQLAARYTHLDMVKLLLYVIIFFIVTNFRYRYCLERCLGLRPCIYYR